jgi:mono/diheme cytochrome c family protein
MTRLAGKLSPLLFACILAGGGQAAAQQADQDLIKKGEYLATLGDCAACHTKPGGEPFAGNRAIQTPFGAILSQNITPDKEFGIGNWTDDQFYNALHNGIGDDGEYLYPVFPFDHYTKVSREDVLAIKAYLLASVKPVHEAKQPNNLSFPYSVRSAMAVWRTLFFKPGEFKPDPSKSAEINRGAYLVEGLAHCGACHTTRNMLGAEITGDQLRGAAVQGWYAPNITSGPEGIGSWSDEELAAFLKTGATPKQGVAVGPMAETVHESLVKWKDEDIHAVVAYLKSTPAKNNVTEASSSFGMTRTGEQVYLSYCASCHQMNGEGVSGKIPPLAENGSVTASGPQNVVHAVLGGLIASGNYGPMPSYADALSDRDIAAVSDYVRTRWGNRAQANTDPDLVAQTRKEMQAELGTGESGDRCAAFNYDGARAFAEKLPDPVRQALATLEYTTMARQIPQIVEQARTASPGVSAADLTNGLTATLCPTVEAKAGLSLAGKRNVLDQFAQLVYTQAAGGNIGRDAKAAPPNPAKTR